MANTTIDTAVADAVFLRFTLVNANGEYGTATPETAMQKAEYAARWKLTGAKLYPNGFFDIGTTFSYTTFSRATTFANVFINGLLSATTNSTANVLSIIGDDITVGAGATFLKPTVHRAANLQFASANGTPDITLSRSSTGELDINANTNLGGTLDVTGNATVGGTSAVTGNGTVGGTLAVTGNTSIGGTATVTGNTTLSGTLAVTGNGTFSANLSVQGAAAISGNASVSGNAAVTGNATVGGTLSVTGNTTLGANLTVSGATLSAANNIVGQVITANGSLAIFTAFDRTEPGKYSQFYMSGHIGRIHHGDYGTVVSWANTGDFNFANTVVAQVLLANGGAGFVRTNDQSVAGKYSQFFMAGHVGRIGHSDVGTVMSWANTGDVTVGNNLLVSATVNAVSANLTGNLHVASVLATGTINAVSANLTQNLVANNISTATAGILTFGRANAFGTIVSMTANASYTATSDGFVTVTADAVSTGGGVGYIGAGHDAGGPLRASFNNGYASVTLPVFKGEEVIAFRSVTSGSANIQMQFTPLGKNGTLT